MLKLVIPLVLALVGTGAGVGVGLFLRPEPPPPEPMTEAEMEAEKEAAKMADDAPAEDRDYVKLNNQFVIPVVEDGEVASLVVMSLSIEIAQGFRELIFQREPKLRDAFLQVLFDHANIGGFRGAFTDNSNLDVLRASLRAAAIKYGGDFVSDVLILEIARQDY